jgi:S-adenosylmethionine:tRNA ribosyltransferase-isomerase
MSIESAELTFDLDPALAASEPAEAHGTARDGVRLMVARPDRLLHTSFDQLGAHLDPGDLLVVNTSATLPAAVDGRRWDGRAVVVHFSTELPKSRLDHSSWAVELRAPGPVTGPERDGSPQEPITLPDGVRLTLLAPYRGARLWRAQVQVEIGVTAYLQRVGRPIAYSYVPARWPLAMYQTVFAREPGSAEMPSAARPFTTALVTDLVTRGVAVAPLWLHTGVSSLETREAPVAERFSVPAATARQVNATRRAGCRVVAVGTTVTRALESVASPSGRVRPAAGWTDLVLGPDRPARVVDGLITGWHAPGASHLRLLQAVAGRSADGSPALVEVAYAAALAQRYRWHEFGDSCLLLP